MHEAVRCFNAAVCTNLEWCQFRMCAQGVKVRQAPGCKARLLPHQEFGLTAAMASQCLIGLRELAGSDWHCWMAHQTGCQGPPPSLLCLLG